MEASTLPADEAQVAQPESSEEGAPVEGAEATRSAAHLFAYSRYVHAGGGALECEHSADGKCEDEGHLHAWVCLPNTLQTHDIEEKARAGEARRKRLMRDEGTAERPPSDAYVILEGELDDLLDGDRSTAYDLLANRHERKRLPEVISEVAEDERFEHYEQDREEYLRLAGVSEEERDEDEWSDLDRRISDFGKAVDEAMKRERENHVRSLQALDERALREQLRAARVETEARLQYNYIYYQWLAFVCTRKPHKHQTRVFAELSELRNAAPEAITAIDESIRDLEGRFARGDAAGN